MPAIKFTWKRVPPLSVADHRRAARRKVPDMVWAYVDGGADDLVTLGANRAAFRDWDLRTRVLTGNEGTDLSATVAGVRLDLPIFLAPTGMTGLANWVGELAAAQAAEAAGTRAVISTASSYSPEEIAAGTSEDHFFQLYAAATPTGGLRQLTESYIARAAGAGMKALVVTVDVPAPGNREGERRTGMGVPPTLRPGSLARAALTRPAWCVDFIRHQRSSGRMLVDGGGPRAGVESVKVQYRLMRAELNWADFDWMREQWKGPLIVKGVLDPQDARIAVDHGADGVYVSNHGGRQLDGAPASLRALPAIVDRVGDDVPVYMDGGIRRGTDVVKALALGATAVGIGRPYVYGLASGGRQGVADVLEIFRQEIARCLTFMGLSSVRQLTREHLIPHERSLG